jgi:hypothetical protein
MHNGPSQQETGASDWEPARTLCHALMADDTEVAAAAIDSIRAELPGYAVVDRAEQERIVREQLLALFAGLADRTLPGKAEADHARRLGRRRAAEGLPVEALLGAYHVAYREAWDALLNRARAVGAAQERRLLGAVSLLWVWLRVMTSAAADGYADQARAQDEARTSLEHRFIETLYGGPDTAELTASLARALGFDPQGDFQAACSPAASWPPRDLELLRRRYRFGAGPAVTAVRGTTLVIVAQDVPAGLIHDLERGGDAPVTAGVGLLRPGLDGAAASLADAERAMALALLQGGVVCFRSEWLAATLLPYMSRLRPLTDPGPAAGQAHLRDAVQAYARHGFSITAGARALHIHPNTMKYRLDRWQQLTGWDARTLDGLLRSVLSITLPAPEAPAAGHSPAAE